MIADFNKKRNRVFFNSKLLFKTVGIIFLIIIFVLIIADLKMYNKKRELDAKIVAYQKQIEDIKENSQTLKDEIANANDTDYLEKLGYEQLDQTRPGETEYMFVKPQKKAEIISESENLWNAKSWFGNIWQWIKNNF